MTRSSSTSALEFSFYILIYVNSYGRKNMKRTASEILSDLDRRLARLERTASRGISDGTTEELLDRINDEYTEWVGWQYPTTLNQRKDGVTLVSVEDYYAVIWVGFGEGEDEIIDITKNMSRAKRIYQSLKFDPIRYPHYRFNT